MQRAGITFGAQVSRGLRRAAGLRHGGILAVLCLLLAGCTSAELASHAAKQLRGPGGERPVGAYKVGNPYQISGIWYYPKVDYEYDATGIASWYGPGFHGRKTANGEIYDQNDLTAAHPTLPMPSIVNVTNLENGRAINVRINDRGPFKNGRIIDLSRRAAQLLGMERQGTAKVRVRILEEESRQHAALAQNRVVAANAPAAVPTEAVTAEPLAAPGAEAQPATQTAAAVNGTPQPDAAARQNATPWPDGQVSQSAVQPSSIYIQAGAFRRLDNATRLSIELSRVAESQVTRAAVGDQHFYRVRLGPLASVAEADELLRNLFSSGHNDARVVVD